MKTEDFETIEDLEAIKASGSSIFNNSYWLTPTSSRDAFVSKNIETIEDLKEQWRH